MTDTPTAAETLLPEGTLVKDSDTGWFGRVHEYKDGWAVLNPLKDGDPWEAFPHKVRPIGTQTLEASQ